MIGRWRLFSCCPRITCSRRSHFWKATVPSALLHRGGGQSTVAPHLPEAAALGSVGVFDPLMSPSPRASVATPCSSRHLRRLATCAGESCRL